ncbi:Uncharacterized protein FWK35_00026812 [Aphis craccivora]|uniref:Uncharacterized protein n=1 Tax=Aphis craccivora TaxID=307492 RepID=A0A6G0W1X0_APHCR|nr:Uncharacterized protein FWK35_00026812 [Aphis craccivora]
MFQHPISCGKNCDCRKAGLKCSIICRHCKGQWCTNYIEIEVDYTEDCTLEELLDETVEEKEEYRIITFFFIRE